MFVGSSFIFLGEGFLFVGLLNAALWTYLIAVVVCSVIPFHFRATAAIFSAFLLLPVFRLVNLAMPVFVDLTVYWILVVYAPFLIAGGYYLWQLDIIGVSVPPLKLLLWLPVALVGGVALAELTYRVDVVALLVPEATTAGLLLLGSVVVLGAVVEEILFRGILQTVFDRNVHGWLAVALATLLFAAMRAPMGQRALGIGLITGLVFGVSYARSESLIVPVVFHGMLNVTLFTVLPEYGSLIAMVASFG